MAADAHTPTRICRVLLGLAVLWGVLGCSGRESWAGNTKATRATLRDVEGLWVLVETIRPEVAQAGFTAQKLQTDVEWRLRHAGMRVLTDEERRGTPRSPFLYVNMIVYLRPHAFASFHIHVGFNQLASLTTESAPPMVTTWSCGSTGKVRSARLAALRNPVRAHGDAFVNAYLSVPPRPRGRATPSSTSPGVTVSARSRSAYRPLGFTLERLTVR